MRIEKRKKIRNVLAWIWIVYLAGAYSGLFFAQNYFKSEPTKVPTLTEIQMRIGAFPDGRYGQETKRLWNQTITQERGECYEQF